MTDTEAYNVTAEELRRADLAEREAVLELYRAALGMA
jgi:uncharacterized protein (UPF0335 family)